VIKSSDGTESMFVNGANVGSFGHEKNYTGYLSPYFVFREGSFTKHYYIGSQRIVSKIGNGRFDNNSGLNGNGITAGGINFAKQQSWYDKKVEEYIASLGIPPGPPDKKGIYGSPEYTGQPYPDFGSPLNENNEPPLGWPKVPVFNQPGDVPGPPIKWGDPVTNDNVEAGWGYEGTGVIEETDLYFYHPDHLGSTSYVTTRLGKVSQHVEYIPFGEVFLEEKNDKWNTPYKFNAKEFDEETGLYYYGARYFDSKISVWYSVDKPLIDGTYLSGKHNGGVYNSSNLNGYAYCYQNPVILVDPDGNQAFFMHGTWSDHTTWSSTALNVGNQMANNSGIYYKKDWSGGNSKSARKEAADNYYNYILKVRKDESKSTNPIVLMGHSHGGNVAVLTTNKLVEHYQEQMNKGEISQMPEIILVTLNTPVRPDYQLTKKSSVTHYNVFNMGDNVQVSGGSAWDITRARHTFPYATNIHYEDFFQNSTDFKEQYSECGITGHCGTASENAEIWGPTLLQTHKEQENKQ
jgi:RHS repeat-associated protein